jgi:membrane-bound metal-dependent hydrolase YbcI (DUF457 family)
LPSPIGHTLAALALARLFENGSRGRRATAVICAVAPDFDLVPAITGRGSGSRHGWSTHSLAAALAAALAAGTVGALTGDRFSRCFALGGAAYGSHLLLDIWGKEEEDGIPLLWPVTEERFGVKEPWFRTLKSRRGSFVRGLLTRRNVRVVAREILTLLPLTLAVYAIRRA